MGDKQHYRDSMSESESAQASSEELLGFSQRQVWWISVISLTSVSLLITSAILVLPLWYLGYFREMSLIFAVGGTCVGISGIGVMGYIRETVIPAGHRDSAERIGSVLQLVGTVLLLVGVVLGVL